jgi:hypothetical protein
MTRGPPTMTIFPSNALLDRAYGIKSNSVSRLETNSRMFKTLDLQPTTYLEVWMFHCIPSILGFIPHQYPKLPSLYRLLAKSSTSVILNRGHTSKLPQGMIVSPLKIVIFVYFDFLSYLALIFEDPTKPRHLGRLTTGMAIGHDRPRRGSKFA